MKKTLLFFGVAAAVVFAASCKQNNNGAAEAAPAQDSTAVAGSIVYFNIRRGKKLEKDASDFQSKVDKGLLTTSVAQAQYQKLQQQQQEYQEYAVRKQQEMAEEQQVMMNQIANAIAEFVAQYNEEHQYAMILATAGGILSTPVVCGDARLDITDDLLAGLNAAYIKTKETTKK